MVVRKEAQELAAELIAYLIGDEYMTPELRANLSAAWNRARGKDVDTPIDKIEDDDLMPEDLPAPIET